MRQKQIRVVPIIEAPPACALSDLKRDSFSVIATKVKSTAVTDIWEYTFNDQRDQLILHREREAGRIVTIQGYVDGVATLYAKLAA